MTQSPLSDPLRVEYGVRGYMMLLMKMDTTAQTLFYMAVTIGLVLVWMVSWLAHWWLLCPLDTKSLHRPHLPQIPFTLYSQQAWRHFLWADKFFMQMWAFGFPSAAIAWASVLYDATIDTALR